MLVVFLIRKVMRWARQDTLGGNKQLYLDQDKGAEARDIQKSLRTYLHARGVGGRARATSNQVKAADEKMKNLSAIIDAKFTIGSISWAKFTSAVETAHGVLMRNCTILANRINFFDVRDYQTLDRANSSLLPQNSAQPADVQMQRLSLMNDSIRTMDDIIAANERLLLEMDKLSLELEHVGQEEAETTTGDILDEIRVLSEQAKLYQ